MREMFGFARLKSLVGRGAYGERPHRSPAEELGEFTGEAGSRRTTSRSSRSSGRVTPPRGRRPAAGTLAEFERRERAGQRAGGDRARGGDGARVGIDAARLERLKTAVGEATMNAMEHGNGYRLEPPGDDSCLGDRRRTLSGRNHRPRRRAGDAHGRSAGPRGQARRGAGAPRLGPFPDRRMVDELETTNDGPRTPSGSSCA